MSDFRPQRVIRALKFKFSKSRESNVASAYAKFCQTYSIFFVGVVAGIAFSVAAGFVVSINSEPRRSNVNSAGEMDHGFTHSIRDGWHDLRRRIANAVDQDVARSVGCLLAATNQANRSESIVIWECAPRSMGSLFFINGDYQRFYGLLHGMMLASQGSFEEAATDFYKVGGINDPSQDKRAAYGRVGTAYYAYSKMRSGDDVSKQRAIALLDYNESPTEEILDELSGDVANSADEIISNAKKMVRELSHNSAYTLNEMYQKFAGPIKGSWQDLRQRITTIIDQDVARSVGCLLAATNEGNKSELVVVWGCAPRSMWSPSFISGDYQRFYGLLRGMMLASQGSFDEATTHFSQISGLDDTSQEKRGGYARVAIAYYAYSKMRSGDDTSKQRAIALLDYNESPTKEVRDELGGDVANLAGEIISNAKKMVRELSQNSVYTLNEIYQKFVEPIKGSWHDLRQRITTIIDQDVARSVGCLLAATNEGRTSEWVVVWGCAPRSMWSLFIVHKDYQRFYGLLHGMMLASLGSFDAATSYFSEISGLDDTSQEKRAGYARVGIAYYAYSKMRSGDELNKHRAITLLGDATNL